jgi:hypothetical protein
MEKIIRCTTCRSEFTEEEVNGYSSCPTCGHPGLPCAISEDVTIKINWHELHILGVWAENWARKIDEKNQNQRATDCLFAIVKAIQDQYPSKHPLTLAGEIKGIKESGLVKDIQTSLPCREDAPLPPKRH